MRVVKIGKTAATEVQFDDGRRVLFSYQTPVAVWVPVQGWYRTNKFYSVTTSRHISMWGVPRDARLVGPDVLNDIAEGR